MPDRFDGSVFMDNVKYSPSPAGCKEASAMRARKGAVDPNGILSNEQGSINLLGAFRMWAVPFV